MIQTARVIKSHQSPFPEPVIFKKGEKVEIGDKQTDMIGWVWCITSGNIAGWVPENFIEISGKLGTALRGYNAHELTIESGEELELLEQEAGWYWCRRSGGELGWIPEENVEMIAG